MNQSVLRLFLFTSIFTSSFSNNLRKIQNAHKEAELSDNQLRYLASLTDKQHMNDILDNILIPRVVGSDNHKKVQNYIKSELDKLNWKVEVDTFHDNTPIFGKLQFSNIIGTLNPNAERYLVLACHYDSKYFKDEEFVGATDSAVPCAMLLNLARTMKNDLVKVNNSDVSIKLVFFDGEEAFEEWGPNDSIYGARHLANKYHQTVSQNLKANGMVSELDKIDMMILLDLIGHRRPSFYNFFENTLTWYLRMVNAEERLKRLGLLENVGRHVYFKKATSHGRIEDDHIPFLKRNVPILHLISTPFPSVWHTVKDNRSIVDLEATENINKIIRVFVAEYLHMSVTE